MQLHRSLGVRLSDWRLDIFGTDISEKCLGVAPADIPRAFDMFSRFNSGVEGNGLGLAIVARQVEALGGQITIEPLEKGTAFVLHLPDAVPQQHRKVAS